MKDKHHVWEEDSDREIRCIYCRMRLFDYIREQTLEHTVYKKTVQSDSNRESSGGHSYHV
jgi:DNA-directed RNA polymerase subunit RPC12/RpoP